MLTNEVDLQLEDSNARASSWFESLTDSFDLTNTLFPDLNLSFTMNYGGEVHEYNTETNANRTL